MQSSRNHLTTRRRLLAAGVGLAAGAALLPRRASAAEFSYKFATSQVSKLDYFHPSVSGQSGLAAVTWSASWWPGT